MAAIIPIIANLMTIFVALLLSMPLLFLRSMKDFDFLSHVMLFIFFGTGLIIWKPHIILKIYNIILSRLGYAKISVTIKLGFRYLQAWVLCWVNVYVEGLQPGA